MSPSDPTDAVAATPAGTTRVASAADDGDAAVRREARRVFVGRWAVPLVALAWSLGITIRTHLFFMVPYATPVSNDEGYLAAMALRMVRGSWLPYVDGVS